MCVCFGAFWIIAAAVIYQNCTLYILQAAHIPEIDSLSLSGAMCVKYKLIQFMEWEGLDIIPNCKYKYKLFFFLEGSDSQQ
jgi:hypothetical protein